MFRKSKTSPHSRSSQNILRLSGATLIGAASLFLLGGCGGGSSSSGNSNGSNSSPQTQNYSETIALPTGQTGALALAVQPSGAVTGTLNVAAQNSALRQRWTANPRALAALAPGIYTVTGTLTSNGYTLTGTLGSSAFTITGALPTGSSPANFTLTVGTGANAAVYTGTLATTPNGNGTLSGTYLVTAIGNTATGQTQTCPGTLAFAGNDPDTCGSQYLLILKSDGTLAISENGTTTRTGTYALNGTVLTLTTQPTGSSQTTTDVFSAAPGTGANTLVLTRLSTTDSTNQPQVGEQFFLTNNTTTAATPYAGTYQGVYLNTSGQYSPDAGTIAFTVSQSGAVSGSDFDYTGDSSTTNFTGNINNSGALALNTAGSSISGSLSQNSTSHVLAVSYTESNGTKGVLSLGLAPTASPLAGSYSGTASNSTGQFPISLTISATGAITGTLGTLSTANQGFSFVGSVDTANNIFLAYTSGGVPAKSVGSLTLSGTALTGTLQEAAADGSSSTATLSLTKH